MAPVPQAAPQPADPDLAPLGVKLGIAQPWRWCLNRHPLLILLIFGMAYPGLNWLNRWLNSFPYDFTLSWLTILDDSKLSLATCILAMMLRKGNDVPASFFPAIKPRWQRVFLVFFVLGSALLAVMATMLSAPPVAFMLWLLGFAGLVFTMYAVSFQLYAVFWMFRRHQAWEAPEMWVGMVAVALLILGVPLLKHVL